MNSNNQVVVTGMGVVSPIGMGVDAYWDSLLQGRSGVRVRKQLQDHPWPLKIFSPVSDFDGKQWVRPRKALKVMCMPIQFGYAAARMAIEQAGIGESGINSDRFGTVFGSETFFSDPTSVTSVFHECMTNGRYTHDRWGEVAMRNVEPLWMLKHLPNMVTSHISIAADARGPSNTICQGEVSSILALLEGRDLIQRGLCDAVVVGGTGSQTSISAMLYRGQHLLSNRTDEPERACRPFDRDREGTVFGEGAGAILIENADHARARGAEILCAISGSSRSFCPPESKKLKQSIRMALEQVLNSSQISVADIAHVNAHAAGFVVEDSQEAMAIEELLGNLPVFSAKSNFGYLGPGSGVIELIASIQSLTFDLIPPSLNFENPDSSCPVNVCVTKSESKGRSAIKISYSKQGQIAALAIEKP